MKLTTTVGNVKSPTINPTYPYYVAFTATYSGHREAYLMDLRPSHRHHHALRLTYWDTPTGVSEIAGWKDDGMTLVIAAYSRDISLVDMRLYQIALHQEGQSVLPTTPMQVMKISPIPLSQALNGVWHEDCLFFTRFKQSSHTVRYVGGTAESIWAYCENQEVAVPLDATYEGTTKNPRIAVIKNKPYLFFLSDRDGQTMSKPSTMNLFAVPLPTMKEIYNDDDRVKKPLLKKSTTRILTKSSCQFKGLAVMEYDVDSSTGVVILRIGADLHAMSKDTVTSILTGNAELTTKDVETMAIVMYSDFHEQQERLLPVSVSDYTSYDVFTTAFGSTATLLGVRGQLYVAPVVASASNPYEGAGMNMPPRRYRVIPGSTTGGMVRVIGATFVPIPQEATKTTRRLAVVLATDPKSPTAEHGFFLVEIQSDSLPSFVHVDDLPDPFAGGSKNGGSVAEGGLGSVVALVVSPCGRRMAWTDTDGRIAVMTMPLYQQDTDPKYKVLPQTNQQGEPVIGIEAELSWSPGGWYIAITHAAKNQFQIISVADCGDPNIAGTDQVADIEIGTIGQATPARFNSASAYWGKTAMDFAATVTQASEGTDGEDSPKDGATVLYFLSDRDVVSDVKSPWGTRAPSPHFPESQSVFALPLLTSLADPNNPIKGIYGGSGAAELWADGIIELASKSRGSDRRLQPTSHTNAAAASSFRRNGELQHHRQVNEKEPNTNPLHDEEAQETAKPVQTTAQPTSSPSVDESTSSPSVAHTRKPEAAPTAAPLQPSPAPTPPPKPSPIFPNDREIEFGDDSLSFARRAYRLAGIPAGKYHKIVCQLQDDPSLILVEEAEDGANVAKLFAFEDFPSDQIEGQPLLSDAGFLGATVSTARDHLLFVFSPHVIKVVPNSASSVLTAMKDTKLETEIADTDSFAISVWPALEYEQIFNDAWRMLRDYFYDANMNGVDWKTMQSRYKDLVKRCAKREDLDDVLGQMAGELSALHVFVYGGEYNDPLHDDSKLKKLHEIASLGATLERSQEYNGYIVTSIAEGDPDYSLQDGSAIYSPLSDRVLSLTGQTGVQVGDVIVGINGENLIRVPDLHSTLRGMAGRSVRLDVIRQPNLQGTSKETDLSSEPVICVPISQKDSATLRYNAWEWRTRTMAEQLAAEKGFSVGYIHLKSMSGPDDINAFVRDFFPAHDRQGLIIDVRHNRGGNIDAWLLEILQRQSWMFWEGRATNIRNGGLGWDEQFAFRGHIAVLIDEKTSSDGEGFARGMSELGLGRLVGKRTWGGGIWLSSDNVLVDGGIATAPEIGTYNDKFGWGLGIEQQGVEPNIEVDNNPRKAFDGIDQQLERAIGMLDNWIRTMPIVEPKDPKAKRDMSEPHETCRTE